MTPTQYDAKIEQAEKDLNKLVVQRSAWQQSLAGWEAALARCKSGKSGDTCRADNTAQVNRVKTLVSTASSQIKQKEIEIENLVEDRRLAAQSAPEISRILAQQGQTQESVTRSAELSGEAQAQAMRIQAEAQAQALVSQADADASNKKKMGIIIVAVVVVVVVVVGIILWKKFKK